MYKSKSQRKREYKKRQSSPCQHPPRLRSCSPFHGTVASPPRRSGRGSEPFTFRFPPGSGSSLSEVFHSSGSQSETHHRAPFLPPSGTALTAWSSGSWWWVLGSARSAPSQTTLPGLNRLQSALALPALNAHKDLQTSPGAGIWTRRHLVVRGQPAHGP